MNRSSQGLLAAHPDVRCGEHVRYYDFRPRCTLLISCFERISSTDNRVKVPQITSDLGSDRSRTNFTARITALPSDSNFVVSYRIDHAVAEDVRLGVRTVPPEFSSGPRHHRLFRFDVGSSFLVVRYLPDFLAILVDDGLSDVLFCKFENCHVMHHSAEQCAGRCDANAPSMIFSNRYEAGLFFEQTSLLLPFSPLANFPERNDTDDCHDNRGQHSTGFPESPARFLAGFVALFVRLFPCFVSPLDSLEGRFL